MAARLGAPGGPPEALEGVYRDLNPPNDWSAALRAYRVCLKTLFGAAVVLSFIVGAYYCMNCAISLVFSGSLLKSIVPIIGLASCTLSAGAAYRLLGEYKMYEWTERNIHDCITFAFLSTAFGPFITGSIAWRIIT